MGRFAALVAVAALGIAIAMPASATATTCSSHSTQAEAQAAADTVDADGDGIYCESLPCPCSSDGGSGNSPPPPPPPAKPKCTTPKTVKRLVFSKTKYRNIRAHYVRAVKKGWPRIQVVNRKRTDQRRARLLSDVPVVAGFDRDEYPAAVGRGRGRVALKRGRNPTGWKADVEYVPSSENRSHGAKLGAKLKRYCSGTRFRYIFK